MRTSHAICVVSQVASAIAFLHKRKIYHCAIRTSNVFLIPLVCDDPVAKLGNFAQCRFLSKKSKLSRTLEHEDVSELSLLYSRMVPGNGGSPSIESDDYACACIMVDALGESARGGRGAEVIAEELYALLSKIREGSAALENTFAL